MKGSAVPSQLAPIPLRGRQDSAQDGDPGAARAWLREMERAQMEAWLCHAVVGCAQRTHSSGLMPASGKADTNLAAAESARAGSQLAQRSIHAPGFEPIRQSPLQAGELPQPHGQPWTTNAARANAQLVVEINEFASFSVTTSFDGQACPPESVSAGWVSARVLSPVDTAGTRLHDPTRLMPERFVRTDHVAPTPVLPPGYGADLVQVAALASTNFSLGQLQPLRRLAPGEAQDVRPPVAAGPRAGDPGPIRLHAHWSAEGVRLWLGMDSSVISGLQSISAQLQRWLSAQGVRLLSISCNGRVIVGSTEKEMSWPSVQ